MTLPSTKIDQSDKEVSVGWNIYDISSETKTWCCPFVDSVEVNEYLLCADKDCRKKVTPHLGNEKVLCNSPTCKRKIFLSQCKSVINADILLTDKKDNK